MCLITIRSTSGDRRCGEFIPELVYPGVEVGFGFLPGVDIGLYFGGWGGWGWGGWGWGPNWFGGGIFIDYSFFHRYGFGEFHGELGRGVWAHDPAHRFGVPYPNREVAGRFAGRRNGSGARRLLIAVQPRLVWEIRGSSSAGITTTTAFLADITTAE